MTATIRAATLADTRAIFALTYELAEFEGLTHVFVATEDGLRDAMRYSRCAAGCDGDAGLARRASDGRCARTIGRGLCSRQRRRLELSD